MSSSDSGFISMHSTDLSFGRGRRDGAPNALFDSLNRVVCSFPSDRRTDSRRGSPSTPEVILANAKLFQGSPRLLTASKALLDWGREHVSPLYNPEAHSMLVELHTALELCCVGSDELGSVADAAPLPSAPPSGQVKSS